MLLVFGSKSISNHLVYASTKTMYSSLFHVNKSSDKFCHGLWGTSWQCNGSFWFESLYLLQIAQRWTYSVICFDIPGQNIMSRPNDLSMPKWPMWAALIISSRIAAGMTNFWPENNIILARYFISVIPELEYRFRTVLSRFRPTCFDNFDKHLHLRVITCGVLNLLYFDIAYRQRPNNGVYMRVKAFNQIWEGITDIVPAQCVTKRNVLARATSDTMFECLSDRPLNVENTIK